MNITSVSLADQLKMLKGVEPIMPKAAGETPAVGGEKKMPFVDFLEQTMAEVNEQGLAVDQAIRETAEGKSANPHETMIAIQKADVSFRLMMSVKEQLEQAYQTIMRTSVG